MRNRFAEVIHSFCRGMFLVSPGIIVGLVIARYVPDRIAGYGALALLALLIYAAGDALPSPWKKRY